MQGKHQPRHAPIYADVAKHKEDFILYQSKNSFQLLIQKQTEKIACAKFAGKSNLITLSTGELTYWPKDTHLSNCYDSKTKKASK